MGQPLRKQTKKKKVLYFEAKEEYFINNGNILQEKLIALTRGRSSGVGQVKILSAKEIESAISNCKLSGTFGYTDWMLYKVTLDGRIRTIAASRQHFEQNPELTNRVLTDIATRMAMNHANIGKIYGCCLETCVPIRVLDFWPKNQTLFEHLHGSTSVNKSLKWFYRLRIATDVSYALSYMHNALQKPVVHRAIQSIIIPLADSFHAKLADFGYSVVIEPGETSRRWPVEGIPGYIDPEYIETQVVTDKCDVYSFGVLMLELLTGKNPMAMAESRSDLVKEFVKAVEKNCMMKMIDNEVMAEARCAELEQVAQLALICVASKGEDRPTMIGVVRELWKVQGIYSK